MKVFATLGDQGGCGYYRLSQPLGKAKQNGHDVIISEKYNWSDLIGYKISEKKFLKVQPKIKANPELEKKYKIEPPHDLYIMQRQCQKMGVIRMAFLKQKGKKVIYEIDDLLWDIDRTNPAYETYMSAEALESMMHMLSMADAVTVSTEPLRKQIASINPRVYLLPNCLDQIKWEQYRQARAGLKSDGFIRLGYAGSTSHYNDIRIIRNVLPAILRKHPQAKLKLIGFDWREVFKTEFKGLADRVEVLPWTDLEQYPFGLTDIDIGLAPLANTEFNQAKSNLKWLEYSSLAIPTVASNVEPYRCIKHGHTGVLVNGENEAMWTRELTSLINSRAVRERIGQAAQAEVVADYDLNKTWCRWMEVYSEVYNAG